MDTIGKEHSQRKLAAHGVAVGLSEGLMGNSEVGYVSSPNKKTVITGGRERLTCGVGT